MIQRSGTVSAISAQSQPCSYGSRHDTIHSRGDHGSHVAISVARTGGVSKNHVSKAPMAAISGDELAVTLAAIEKTVDLTAVEALDAASISQVSVGIVFNVRLTR